MAVIKKQDEEERPGHKVDFNATWQDFWKKEKWEMVIGEFSGKPFELSLDKYFKDKCKLFRCMKDIHDLRVTKITKLFHSKISKEMYDLVQTMQVFGVHSHGTTIDIYILNKPFPHIYIINLWCSLAVPYRKTEAHKNHICNLIEKLWTLLRDGIVEEILKILKIHKLSTAEICSSYTCALQNSRAITIVSPAK